MGNFGQRALYAACMRLYSNTPTATPGLKGGLATRATLASGGISHEITPFEKNTARNERHHHHHYRSVE